MQMNETGHTAYDERYDSEEFEELTDAQQFDLELYLKSMADRCVDLGELCREYMEADARERVEDGQRCDAAEMQNDSAVPF